MFRSRSIIFRYTILILLFLTIYKTFSLYYFHLPVQTSHSTLSSSLSSKIKQRIDTTPINKTTLRLYRQYVKRKNEEQTMLNQHLFSLANTQHILLVQVHKRVVYLRKFIEMLRQLETIEKTLVIFSHDFIDSDINQLISNITFVPVIQIFYPFSQQLYPNEFPGLDPNDCPRDLPKALDSRCNNAAHPDRYGHYREVSIVQIKHHWWWKLNFVFNSIEVLRNHTDGLLLLLEEDFYLSPDALVFLRKMEAEKSKICPECLFYTLGNFEKTGRNFPKLGSKVSIAYWHARYNLGMTLTHSIWKLLVKYAEEFCTIDDYNWDWSLVYLVQKRFQFPRVLWSTATRLIHLGSCGTHHLKTCSSESDVARWTETEKFYQQHGKYLFPTDSLSLHLKYDAQRLFKQPNGGWSDLRDQQLCLSFAIQDRSNFSLIKT